jgi:hypothetical protein
MFGELLVVGEEEVDGACDDNERDDCDEYE